MKKCEISIITKVEETQSEEIEPLDICFNLPKLELKIAGRGEMLNGKGENRFM